MCGSRIGGTGRQHERLAPEDVDDSPRFDPGDAALLQNRRYGIVTTERARSGVGASSSRDSSAASTAGRENSSGR